MDDQVTLRPVQEGDLALLDRLVQDPRDAGEYGWCGWLGRDLFRAGRWRDGGTYSVLRPEVDPEELESVRSTFVSSR